MTYPFLDRLRVIESSAFIAAPLAGLTLAQFGAQVIRIDMIGGGIDYARLPRMPQSGRSLYWTALNKGKRSVAIDLRQPQGRELVQALATAPGANAGVLLTNIGTPWLAHDVLAQRRPDVISCTIQGNADGSTAVDYTVNCATGYPAVTGGGSAQHPVNHVLPAWDIACAYQAAFAIVAAVNRRQRSGEGAELKLALSDMAFSMLSHLGLLPEAQLLGQDRPSIGGPATAAMAAALERALAVREQVPHRRAHRESDLCRHGPLAKRATGAEHGAKRLALTPARRAAEHMILHAGAGRGR